MENILTSIKEDVAETNEPYKEVDEIIEEEKEEIVETGEDFEWGGEEIPEVEGDILFQKDIYKIHKGTHEQVEQTAENKNIEHNNKLGMYVTDIFKPENRENRENTEQLLQSMNCQETDIESPRSRDDTCNVVVELDKIIEKQQTLKPTKTTKTRFYSFIQNLFNRISCFINKKESEFV